MRAEQNELLTRTGPGTPMGELFRRYWLPALLAEELPGPDCPPVRVEAAAEKLIAFRDTQNRLGLIDEFCAHRGVSLWFGRNEEDGLRCAYHGWKYDVTGQCVDMPSEPDNPRLCQRMKLKSYPLRRARRRALDLHGAARARSRRSPSTNGRRFPRASASSPSAGRSATTCRRWRAASTRATSPSCTATPSRSTRCSRARDRATSTTCRTSRPHFEVVESAGGLYIGARRNADDGKHYWRITQWVMPSFTLIPPRGDHPIGGHCWVPIDDENCWAWSTNHHAARPLTKDEREALEAGKGIHVPVIPGTFRPVANKDNDYLMDRNAQKQGRSFSGVDGFAMQDASVQESMGPIQDRTRENLVPTDQGIVMARRRLIAAAQGLAKGKTPPGTDPRHQRVRSVSIILPPGVAFSEAAEDALIPQPGSAHATV